MLIPRIIPCLLLKDGGLVKTIKFRKPKYIGDPINAVKIFNDKEADELIFLDVDASKRRSEPQYEIIRGIAEEAFMPFSYGGGIRDIYQIEKILRIGVEKVIINSASFNGFELINQAAKEFGSSTVIAAVDIKGDFLNRYHVYSHIKKRSLKVDYLTYIDGCVSAGAGELFINDVDREGTYTGFNVMRLREISSRVTVPIIACGGASKLQDFKTIFNETDVSSAAAGSLFVFNGPHRAVLISYPKRNELENLFKPI